MEETIRTLALLIPNDKRNKAWFKKKQQELGLDTKAGRCGPLNGSSRDIETFRFWRDRLVMLKHAFDIAEPKSLSLLVYDDRKKLQWYTFWVAVLVLILTVFFGLIQSAAGIVQAWAAVRSLPS